MTAQWTTEQIPDQYGRPAIVTGANSGLGLVVARELARAGARVIMTSRDATRGAKARDGIKAAHPAANVVTVSSLNHKMGKIRLDDLQGEQHFSRWGAYAQSKLANLLFTLELDPPDDRRGGRSWLLGDEPSAQRTGAA